MLHVIAGDRTAAQSWRQGRLQRPRREQSGYRAVPDSALQGARSPLLARFRDARHYSYFKASTGSICAARVAGTVPKTTPTTVAAARAMITDIHEMGNS